jgi:hypothetical protein
VVTKSLGPSAIEFPMVVALVFFLPSPATKSPSLTISGMALLAGVPSFPFG